MATKNPIFEDREHIVEVFPQDMDNLRKWLQRPNGALILGNRLVLEAVEHGGIFVRTQPFTVQT